MDYLSGDYSLQDSVNSARFEGRCMQRQGKPWDLMAWSFSGRHAERTWTTKSVVQLEQEAAVVLALGGGFQAYFQQKRDASICAWQMKLMAEVARFCRERQALCHKAEPVAQIAILYPGSTMYRECPKPFGGWDLDVLRSLKGVLQMLLESQNVVDICMEHQLSGRIAEYPLVVVPEWDWLEPKLRDELSDYVKNGGTLLLIGPKAAALFAQELDITLEGDTAGDTIRYLEHDGWLGVLRSQFQKARLGARARAVGRYYSENDPSEGTAEAAAVISAYGKGRVAAVLFNMGGPYLKDGTSVSRAFLQSLVDELFPNPIVRVTGSHYVDVTLMRKDGKLCLNLLNTAGPHGDPDVFVFDEVPPIGPLEVRVRLEKRPVEVTLEPGARKVAWRFADGTVMASLERLAIHDILMVR